MRLILVTILLHLAFFLGNAQTNFTELLKTYNSESVPYMTVDALKDLKQHLIILDAREIEEYNVSHINNAIFVGYNDFDIASVTEQIEDKTASIVVYCSVGIRSENIGEQLKGAGYKNVYNLFGGIFEWKNKGFPVYSKENQPTENVHTFSKKWSKWLQSGIKIYD